MENEKVMGEKVMGERTVPVPSEVPSLMIPIASKMMLLPNVSIAEIVLHMALETTSEGPEWLLGYVQWRGLQVPLLSLSVINGGAPEQVESGGRAAIVNGMRGDLQLPFYGLVVEGLPKLVRVLPNSLRKDRHENLAPGEYCEATIASQTVMIPHLDRIEGMLLAYLNERI